MSVFEPNNLNDRAAMAVFSSNHLYPNPNTQKKGVTMKRILAISIPTAILLFILIRLVISFSNPMGAGIIAIPNWEHGVLICGDKHTTITSAVADAGSGMTNHYLQDHYGAWTINAGHLDDPELKELERVVSFTCAYNYGKEDRTHNHLITNDGTKVEFKGMQLATDTEGQLMVDKDELVDHIDNCDHNFNLIVTK